MSKLYSTVSVQLLVQGFFLENFWSGAGFGGQFSVPLGTKTNGGMAPLRCICISANALFSVLIECTVQRNMSLGSTKIFFST